jgi:hypothetical protein
METGSQEACTWIGCSWIFQVSMLVHVCKQLELQVEKTSKSKACRTAKCRDKGRGVCGWGAACTNMAGDLLACHVSSLVTISGEPAMSESLWRPQCTQPLPAMLWCAALYTCVSARPRRPDTSRHHYAYCPQHDGNRPQHTCVMGCTHCL